MREYALALSLPGAHAGLVGDIEIVRRWILSDPATAKRRATALYDFAKIMDSAFTAVEVWEELRVMVPWYLTRQGYREIRETLVPALTTARPDVWGWLAPVGTTSFTGAVAPIPAVRWAFHILVVIAAREHCGTRVPARIAASIATIPQNEW